MGKRTYFRAAVLLVPLLAGCYAGVGHILEEDYNPRFTVTPPTVQAPAPQPQTPPQYQGFLLHKKPGWGYLCDLESSPNGNRSLADFKDLPVPIPADAVFTIIDYFTGQEIKLDSSYYNHDTKTLYLYPGEWGLKETYSYPGIDHTLVMTGTLDDGTRVRGTCPLDVTP